MNWWMMFGQHFNLHNWTFTPIQEVKDLVPKMQCPKRKCKSLSIFMSVPVRFNRGGCFLPGDMSVSRIDPALFIVPEGLGPKFLAGAFALGKFAERSRADLPINS